MMDCPVINAGDGTGEHPTQALLDALTIRRRFGRIEGLKVAICGDIRHSRVAGSNMRALPLLGAEVRLVGPESAAAATAAGRAALHRSRRGHRRRRRGDDAAHPARADGGGLPRHARATITPATASPARGSTRAAPDAIVMHPGPMNRGVEIDGDARRRSRRARRSSSRSRSASRSGWPASIC